MLTSMDFWDRFKKAEDGQATSKDWQDMRNYVTWIENEPKRREPTVRETYSASSGSDFDAD